MAPNPENSYEWWFIVFGLDELYKGGYYLGKLTCPKEYPQKAPNIKVMTPNARFKAGESICLSVTDFHPESWNPAWTVQHIVLGLVTFWVTRDNTAGAYYSYDYQREKREEKWAKLEDAALSRQRVLDHENFKFLADYAEAIGISNEPAIDPLWEEALDKRAERLGEEEVEKRKQLKAAREAQNEEVKAQEVVQE